MLYPALSSDAATGSPVGYTPHDSWRLGVATIEDPDGLFSVIHQLSVPQLCTQLTCVVGVAVTGCCGLPDGSDRTLMLKVMVQAQQLLARKEALVRHLKSMNLEAARMVRRSVACVCAPRELRVPTYCCCCCCCLLTLAGAMAQDGKYSDSFRRGCTWVLMCLDSTNRALDPVLQTMRKLRSMQGNTSGPGTYHTRACVCTCAATQGITSSHCCLDFGFHQHSLCSGGVGEAAGLAIAVHRAGSGDGSQASKASTARHPSGGCCCCRCHCIGIIRISIKQQCDSGCWGWRGCWCWRRRFRHQVPPHTITLACDGEGSPDLGTVVCVVCLYVHH